MKSLKLCCEICMQIKMNKYRDGEGNEICKVEYTESWL